MSEKKPDSYDNKPNNVMGIIAALMVVLGLSWFLWDCYIRDETPDEKKERLEYEQSEREKVKEAQAEERRRIQRGGR